MHQVPVVPPLHAPLQAQRNQQTYRDRRQVDKEIPPAVYRFMRRMHIKHGLIISCSAIPPSLSNLQSLASVAETTLKQICANAARHPPMDPTHPEHQTEKEL
jgi:hypothetical protein